MIEGITAISDRIGTIYDRIEEIQSLGSIDPIDPLGALDTDTTTEETSEDELSFSEMLEAALGDDADGLSAELLAEGLQLNELGSLLDTTIDTELNYDALYSPLTSQLTASSDLDSIISEAASTYGVDEELIRAVIQQESSFVSDAVSPAGAEGLMQLMPATADLLGVTDSFDETQNVFGGTKYLARLLDYYDSDVVKSLAAYNAGTTAVDNAGGIPNYPETQNYVTKVLGFYADNLSAE